MAFGPPHGMKMGGRGEEKWHGGRSEVGSPWRGEPVTETDPDSRKHHILSLPGPAGKHAG